MKKILILSNHPDYTYNLRKEIIYELLNHGYQVYVSSPDGGKMRLLEDDGVIFVQNNIVRHNVNPFKEIKLIFEFNKIIKEIKPDLVLTYTLKPNLYGNLVCRIRKIPCISNITGLGNSFRKNAILGKFIKILYRFAFKYTDFIFFQNNANYYELNSITTISENYKVIPGSGVNLKEFIPRQLTYKDSDEIVFLFLGRLMKEKGIIELLESIEILSNKYSNIKFNLIGFYEDDYIKNIVTESLSNKNIIYQEHTNDVKPYITLSDAVILPSYHEGMSNALLEGAAMGRPLLASNIPGCKEIIDDGVNGFLFEPRSSDAIVEAVEKFMALSFEERQQMGRKSREKVEREFDRQIVVDAYMEEIERLLGDN